MGKSKIHYAWVIMIACCFIQAAGLGAVMQTAGVFFPPVAAELGFDLAPLALYLTCYFLVNAAMMPLVAKILPNYNIRIVLTVAMIIVAISVALMSTYTELWQFYLSGCLLGVGGGFAFMVPATTLIENWFDKRRGFALGISQACAPIGGAIMAMVLNLCTHGIGWRATYIVLAVVVLVVSLPFTMFVVRFKPADMGLKPYGYEEKSENDVIDDPGLSGKAALRTSAFWLLFIFAGVESLFSGFTNAFPMHGVAIGLGDTFGSSIASIALVGSAVIMICMGWVMDRIGPFKATMLILALTCLGFVGFLVFRSPVPILVSAFIWGANQSVVTLSVARLLGSLFGRKNFTQILAYARMTAILACFASSAVALSYDLTSSYNMAFIGGIIICVLCAILVTAAWAQRGKLQARWTTSAQDKAAAEAANNA